MEDLIRNEITRLSGIETNTGLEKIIMEDLIKNEIARLSDIKTNTGLESELIAQDIADANAAIETGNIVEMKAMYEKLKKWVA